MRFLYELWENRLNIFKLEIKVYGLKNRNTQLICDFLAQKNGHLYK